MKPYKIIEREYEMQDSTDLCHELIIEHDGHFQEIFTFSFGKLTSRTYKNLLHDYTLPEHLGIQKTNELVELHKKYYPNKYGEGLQGTLLSVGGFNRQLNEINDKYLKLKQEWEQREL